MTQLCRFIPGIMSLIIPAFLQATPLCPVQQEVYLHDTIEEQSFSVTGNSIPVFEKCSDQRYLPVKAGRITGSFDQLVYIAFNKR